MQHHSQRPIIAWNRTSTRNGTDLRCCTRAQAGTLGEWVKVRLQAEQVLGRVYSHRLSLRALEWLNA
jgi:hypothetical protein